MSRAQEIHQACAVAKADSEVSDPELDELIARFRLDPAARGEQKGRLPTGG